MTNAWGCPRSRVLIRAGVAAMLMVAVMAMAGMSDARNDEHDDLEFPTFIPVNDHPKSTVDVGHRRRADDCFTRVDFGQPILDDEPSTLIDYVFIPDKFCIGSVLAYTNSYDEQTHAYINVRNPVYDEQTHGTLGNPKPPFNSNPLRYLMRTTRQQAYEDCAKTCSRHPEYCTGFNIVHTGIHAYRWGGYKPPQYPDAATCYFRNKIDPSQVSTTTSRDCFRINKPAVLLEQYSGADAPCVEGETFGYTDDYAALYIRDCCDALIQIGQSEPTRYTSTGTAPNCAYLEFNYNALLIL